MKAKLISISAIFMLFTGILIARCDNSGSGSLFGNLESRKQTDDRIMAPVSEKAPEDKNNYVSENVSDLIYVPEGSFFPVYGQGKMTVSSFHIGKYEITRAEYYKIMGEKPWLRESSPYPLSGIYKEEEIEQNPASGMNWFEAIVFCNRLSIKEKLNPVYSLPGKGVNPDNWGTIPGNSPEEFDKNNASNNNDNSDNSAEKKSQDSPIYLWNRIEVDWNANGYRIPTEMEFIWAALGGIDTQNRKFSGDNGRNRIDSFAWYLINSKGNTHPVGEKKPNILGLFDMTGNVMEWCWDITGITGEIYSDLILDANSDSPPVENGITIIQLPKDDQTDYRGGKLPDSEDTLSSMIIQRAVAGGSWETDEAKSSLTYKEGLFSENRLSDERDAKKLGFRVVRQ